MKDHETLDPQDWERQRKLAHRIMDEALDFVEQVRERPVWQEMPKTVKAMFDVPAPTSGVTLEEVYERVKTEVMPYALGNLSPMFWAWYMGNGTYSGALADFLTSIINSNAGAGNHVGQHLEDQVIKWMNEIIGYPRDSSGIMVSGGSMANFVGLTVARHVKSGFDIRREGMRAGEMQMTVYGSTELHSCNQKAVELLGIGSAYLRKIQTNDDHTINLAALQHQIQEDRGNGLLPICVIGSAGTVNTGAIDDLNGLADLCSRENVWFHIDGAIGAIAMLSPQARPQLSGIERSDSIALDLHKWMHVPFEAGCVLVKNRIAHRDAFVLTPEYLEANVRGIASGNHWYSEYGLQLSRRMRSLKVWMSIQEHGLEKLGRMITKNIEQAHYLEKQIDKHPRLELVAPVGLDIVCFRYIPKSGDSNQINNEILILLHERGLAVPSYTTLGGIYCIRVAISNHRSVMADFDFLIEKTVEIGAELERAVATV